VFLAVNLATGVGSQEQACQRRSESQRFVKLAGWL
jgi:hypothetical protein